MALSAPRRVVMTSIGYGCTLGILSVSTSDLFSAYTGFVHLSAPWVYGAILVLLVLAVLLQGVVQACLVYRALTLLTTAFVAGWALATLVVFCDVADATAQGLLASASELLRRLATIALCIRWNLHLSLEQDLELPKVASLATLLAAALYLFSTVVGPGLLALVAAMVLTSVALLSYLDRRLAVSGEVERETPPAGGERKGMLAGNLTRARFFASRVAWHLGLVFVVVFSYADSRLLPAEPLAVGSLALVFVAVAGLIWWVEEAKQSSISLAVLVPLVVVGGFLAAFLAPRDDGALRVPPVVTTLVWYMLLAVQLPSYRQLTGLGAMRFALLERAVPLIAVYAVYLVLSFVPADGPAVGRSLAVLLSVTFAAVLSAFSAAAMVRHIWHYYPDTAGRPDRVDYEGTLACVTEGLAASHGLTPREKDVLGYFVCGYSKRYVAKALCISTATVKTHAVAIYRKLGIASHDELVDLVTGGR